MIVKMKMLNLDATFPRYATTGAAGFDLAASEDITILPGQTALVKTGLSFEIPEGYELQVRPRSGTSLKTFLRVANSPGTIDSDYRGEVCIIMTNTYPAADEFALIGGASAGAVVIKKGDRIAQGVICPIVQAVFAIEHQLSDTERGEGGFGSTGK